MTMEQPPAVAVTLLQTRRMTLVTSLRWIQTKALMAWMLSLTTVLMLTHPQTAATMATQTCHMIPAKGLCVSKIRRAWWRFAWTGSVFRALPMRESHATTTTRVQTVTAATEMARVSLVTLRSATMATRARRTSVIRQRRMDACLVNRWSALTTYALRRSAWWTDSVAIPNQSRARLKSFAWKGCATRKLETA